VRYIYDDYEDPLDACGNGIYLLVKHFPERDRSRPPPDRLAGPRSARFNTTSAAMMMLALDTYARSNATFIDKLHIEQVGSKGEIADRNSAERSSAGR
jgi:hypothetical protein